MAGVGETERLPPVREFDSMPAPQLEFAFPNLKGTAYQLTSPATPSYNCIAWAAGFSDRWWWPDQDCYWPPTAPFETTLSAFIAAFVSCGYETCMNGDLDPHLEKVAIFTSSGRPTHAARQLRDGQWTSKCGKSEDIAHELGGVTSAVYGTPSVFLARPR